MADDLARVQGALRERYTVQREVGRGGMATVYLAEDLKHHRKVAIKVLRPELAAALGPERFLREITITAQLDHPNILPLLDSGQAGDFLYYVMPFVDGESLRDRVTREKQLPLDEALRITHEVADALSYAHAQRVIHRDIKPENILLADGHARVADFGIARAITAAGGEKFTETGLALGTPTYMSPEQSAGEGDLDPRSDLYALGCVLYEMLAGEPPYSGPSAQAIIAKRFREPVPHVSTMRETVPPAVEAALTRALAKSPADRFSTVALFADALTRQDAVSPMSPPRRSRRVRRLALVAVTVVVAAGGALFILRPGRGGGAAGPAVHSHPRTAIAVLPLENLSPDGANAYFAPGLHDELLTQLSKIAALTVISRTSVMSYAGTKTPLKQIASELDVGSVMEGTVQVVAGRLRVNVQLIDAATDAHFWAEHYDRKLDDAFAIQSEVVQRIVAAVGAALTNPERQTFAEADTPNAEAYRFYLQGRAYLTRPGVQRPNIESAQQLFERALAIDPRFAAAHAALSEVHGRMYWWRYDPSPGRVVSQQKEAEAALRLAPNLPQAHAAMGLAHYWGRRDYQRAMTEFQIALKGLPNDAQLWAWISSLDRRLGKWDEAVAAFEKAAQLDPRNATLLSDQGVTSFVILRRYADAVRNADRALRLAPDLFGAAVNRGWLYASWQGQLDTIRAVLGRLPSDADLGPRGTISSQQLHLFRWERQPDSMLRVLRGARGGVIEGQGFFQPTSLSAARAHQLRGDRVAALAAFDSARVLLDSVLKVRPDDERLHGARGLALAGAGRRAEALREADWLLKSAAYREDAVARPLLAENRARILAQSGEPNAALDEIERLLTTPSYTTVHTLRLDPDWDPIREQPRFKALLVKYAVQR